MDERGGVVVRRWQLMFMQRGIIQIIRLEASQKLQLFEFNEHFRFIEYFLVVIECCGFGTKKAQTSNDIGLL